MPAPVAEAEKGDVGARPPAAPQERTAAREPSPPAGTPGAGGGAGAFATGGTPGAGDSAGASATGGTPGAGVGAGASATGGTPGADGGAGASATGGSSSMGSGGGAGGAVDGGATLPRWVLTWSDEFNGHDNSAVDSTKWVYDTGGSGWGNNELEYYTSGTSNAVVQSGNLVITATTTGASELTCSYPSNGPCG